MRHGLRGMDALGYNGIEILVVGEHLREVRVG